MITSNFRLSLVAVAVAAANPVYAQPAAGQGSGDSGIEEVLVTQVRSRNRLEDVRDVPISISVVQGVELDRLLANDINSIALRTANLSWNQGNQRTSSISIRGIGKVGQTEAQDPSVGVNVDGISYAYNALTSSFDFYDVDTVEVVRGPQGTLLGKNASAGLVNVTTKRPSFDPDAQLQVSIGERDNLTARAALGGPVIDGLLAWRGSFTLQKGEGYQVSQINNDLTWQSKDRASGRIQLLLTPTEDFSARLQIVKTPRAGETTNGRGVNFPTLMTHYDNGAPNTGLDTEQRLQRPYFAQRASYTAAGSYWYGGSGDPNNHGLKLYADTVRPLVTGSNGGILELNWDNLGPFSLTSITGYQDYHFNAYNDDGTPFVVALNSGGYWNDYRQASQEFRINYDESDFVNYQAGVYALRVHNVAQYNQIYGPDAGAWNASNAQYALLDVPLNPDGSASAGQALMRNTRAGLWTATSGAGNQDIMNNSYAVFGQANWNLTDRLTLTTGLRLTREDRNNTVVGYIVDQGDGYELNPVQIRDVPLGGFASNNTSGVLLAGNSIEQLRLADYTASKYFAVAATATPGEAYNSLTAAQKRQVGTAKAMRSSAIGVVHQPVEASPFKDTQPAFVFSPVYRLNDDVNVYFAWQYGEKAGIAQVRQGYDDIVEAEKNNAYEVGIKSSLLNNTLTFNADYYWTTIKDYQQSVRVVDDVATQQNIDAGIEPALVYISQTGNVPAVRAQGIEIDGVYSGIPNTRLRFSFSWTDTFYKDFPNAALPAEQNWPGQTLPYISLSGKTLPGIAKYSGNIGVDWRKPLNNGNELFINANLSYQDKYLNDNSLSRYSLVPARKLVDASFGYGRRASGFQYSLIAKNLFDQDTPLSISASSYIPPEPRWLGVMVMGSF